MKKKIILSLLFCMSIQQNYAARIVFDPQAFTKLIQQVQEARRMVKSLEEQVKALKGKREAGEFVKKQISSFIPEEWRAFMPAGDENLSTAEVINRDKTDFLLKEARVIAHQFKTEEDRLKTIRALAEEASNTQDIKAAQDLQNKIQIEKMVYQENMHQFEVAKSTMEMEEKLSENRKVLKVKCGFQVAAHRDFPDKFQVDAECAHLNDSPVQRNRVKRVARGDGDGSTIPDLATRSNSKWKQLGDTSKKYESGNRGPGAVNDSHSRDLDEGGASYGLYQMSTKAGTIQQYQKYTKYSTLKSLKPGTAEFDRAWKEVARQDPEGFAKEQHAFIKRNYYDRENARLKKYGMDFSSRGRGVQDMIWSTSVQYGNKKIIENALKSQNVNAMSDAQIINTVQDYKLAHYEEHFAKSFKKGLKKKSIFNRIKQERLDLLRITKP
jgi:hypothetical protein